MSEGAADKPAEKKSEISSKEARRLARAQEEAARQQAAAEKAAQFAHLFGAMPLIQSTSASTGKLFDISSLRKDARCGAKHPEGAEKPTPVEEKEEIIIRARLFNVRKKGKMAFLVLRGGSEFDTLQALAASPAVPIELVNFAAGVSAESMVEVHGRLKWDATAAASCTLTGVELVLSKFFVVSVATGIPFAVADANRPIDSDGVTVALDTRLASRWVDLRSTATHATFTLQSKLTAFFRDYLLAHHFTEIHTPKLIGAASEGGASVFGLTYFDKKAFLAQSPQLYKQMVVQGDFPKVFEVGPVFRAEDSNTHRHLAEFVGLDIEMAIECHYDEILNLAEELFASMFGRAQQECAALLERIAAQYPRPPVVFQISNENINKLGIVVMDEVHEKKDGASAAFKDPYGARVRSRKNPILRLPYPGCIALLNEALTKQNEPQLKPTDDLSTPNEKLLGKLVKERYGVDFFTGDRFPSTCRPFYTMPCADDPQFSNSFDIFLRGEEISSGAQRIHDPTLLRSRASALGVDVAPLHDYVTAFEHGAVPHGGFGVGLERLVMLFVGLPNIRLTSMFPRDPQRLTP